MHCEILKFTNLWLLNDVQIKWNGMKLICRILFVVSQNMNDMRVEFQKLHTEIITAKAFKEHADLLSKETIRRKFMFIFDRIDGLHYQQIQLPNALAVNVIPPSMLKLF